MHLFAGMRINPLSSCFLIICLFLSCLLCQCKKDEPENKLAVFPEFSISPETGNTSTLFEFNSTKTNWEGYTSGIQFMFNYDWNFGDGTVKLHADNIEVHQYKNPGEYTIILKVRIENLSTGEIVEGSYSATLIVL